MPPEDNGQQGQQGQQGQAGQQGGQAGEGGILDQGQQGQAGQQGQQGQRGEPAPWYWAENVAGAGTLPPWFKADKYKTVDQQARAAVELEKKLGPATELIGAPETDYTLPDPAKVEGLAGWEWNPEDPILKSVQAAMKAQGFSQKAFEGVVTAAAKAMAAADEQQAASVADAIASLGANAQQRIGQVKQFVVGKIGQEAFEVLNGAIGMNVEAYKALERIVALAAGDAQLAGIPGQQGPGYTKADIEAEQYKVFPDGHPLAGRRMYDHDAEHRAKVDRMWKELYPGDNRQEVG